MSSLNPLNPDSTVLDYNGWLLTQSQLANLSREKESLKANHGDDPIYAFPPKDYTQEQDEPASVVAVAHVPPKAGGLSPELQSWTTLKNLQFDI